jgi:hypothetical protein
MALAHKGKGKKVRIQVQVRAKYLTHLIWFLSSPRLLEKTEEEKSIEFAFGIFYKFLLSLVCILQFYFDFRLCLTLKFF